MLIDINLAFVREAGNFSLEIWDIYSQSGVWRYKEFIGIEVVGCCIIHISTSRE